MPVAEQADDAGERNGEGLAVLRRQVKTVAVVALVAGATTVAAVWATRGGGETLVRTSGERAGPLEHPSDIRKEFLPTSIGTTVESGETFIDNTSGKDATIITVRPLGVTPGLRVTAIKAWLIPKTTRMTLPGSQVGPITDPRIRDAVPAVNVVIPSHTSVQILFFLRPERKGTFEFGGATLEVKAGHTRYLWRIGDTAQVRALCTKSKGKYCFAPG
jgi:hypothetical protein